MKAVVTDLVAEEKLLAYVQARQATMRREIANEYFHAQARADNEAAKS